MDTTNQVNPKCDSRYLLYYYQANTKYPVSTSTVLDETRQFLAKTDKVYSGNGYITLRFIVDCEGKIYRVKVLQVDENYKSIHFDKRLVSDLNDYIHTLDRWEKNLSAYDLKSVSFIAYISFRIKNGEVVNVIY